MKSDLDVKITAGVAIVIFVIALLAKHGDVLGAASLAITVTWALRFAFVKWAWKWFNWLEKLHGVPHIAGLWKGKYRSTWLNEAGMPAEGDVKVTITQPDIFRIKVSQKSDESDSFSYGETFERRDDGSVLLNFSYNNVPDPEFRERSPMNFGSAQLNLLRGKRFELNGNYWTDRKTTGKLELRRS